MPGRARLTKELIGDYLRRGLWQPFTLSDHWERNANHNPNGVAVGDAARAYSWQEAKLWTDRLALALIQLGLERDDLLAIQLPNSVELPLIRVACEKAGILSLPLPRTLRQAEMGHCLGFTEAAAVALPWIFRDFDYFGMIGELRERLPKLRHILIAGDKAPAGALSLDEIVGHPWEEETAPTLLEARRYKAAEVSLINSTTGSTGPPKFAEYTAASRLLYGRSYVDMLGLAERDVLATLSPAAGGPNIPVYFAAPQVGAKIVLLRTRSGGHRLTYEETWLRSPRRRSLSLSLPIGPSREITGASVSSYFENLLPENDNIRRRLGARFRTRGTEAFELLTAIGRDCVGAVQLLPPETAPEGFDRIDGVPVNDAEVERLLRSVTAEPLPDTSEDPDEFRISIAGAQEKTALLHQGGKWFRPRGATPTTHILKLPLGVVLVVEGSLVPSPGASGVEFDVVDRKGAQVHVKSAGVPPQMFRERIGVVVEGTMTRAGYFESRRLMVSHSNEYRVPGEGYQGDMKKVMTTTEGLEGQAPR